MSESLHVLVDCTAIPANRAGVGRYVEGLLRGLEPSDLRLTLVVQERDRETLGDLVPWADIRSLPARLRGRLPRMLWEQFGLPGLARRVGVDVVHSPHYTYPLLWRGGRVVTVHDATFFTEPRTHRPVKRLFFRFWTCRSWRHADAVVAPSASTSGEVERVLGSPRAHIEVARHGVNAARFHPPDAAALAAFRRDTGLAEGETWFAFLGTIEPRKNLPVLLDAYRLLREEVDPAPRLLVSGGRGWDKDALARLDSLPRDSGVLELGYLPVERLSALLGGSVAVLYPSVGEGFGLPVLEAMACGAAVVTTNRLAIPEVGGAAVKYAEIDAVSLKRAMLELLRDEAERRRLGEAAAARAALFTWREAARTHLGAYRAAAGRA